MKKERIYLTLMLSLFGIMFFGGYCSYLGIRSYNGIEYSKYLRLYKEAYRVILENTVDAGVSRDKLFAGGYRGVFASLWDQHTGYLDVDTYKLFNESLDGSYGGVGIVFSKIDNSIRVLYTKKSSPAKKAGIRSHDIIIKVDNKPAIGLSELEFMKLVRGAKGTKVKIVVKRGEETKEFVLEREDIEEKIIEDELVDEGIYYIKLKQFGRNTASKLGKLLLSLKKQKIEGLIIDLRGNGGGTLLSSLHMTSYFLRGGSVIFHMITSNGIEKIYTTREGILRKEPIVMLSDGLTASASEILIGALRDNERGILVGMNTYGKGSIQGFKSFEAIKGRGAKLTYAQWYTPSGQDVNNIGLTPDIKVEEDKLSIETRYNLKKLYKSKLVYEYVKANVKAKHLSQEQINAFIKLVRGRGYILADKDIIRALKREFYLYKEGIVLDMEYDRVLKEGYTNLLKKVLERRKK